MTNKYPRDCSLAVEQDKVQRLRTRQRLPHVVKILNTVKETAGKILDFLEHKSNPRIVLRRSIVDLNPSDTNCQFCNAYSCCKAAKEQGFFRFDFTKKLKQNRKQKAISSISGINDICL